MHNVWDKFKDTHPTEAHFVNTCLTEDGKNQARSVQGPCDVLIVSPLKRALETYVHSKLTTKRLIVNDLFREWTHWGPAQFLEHEDQSRPETWDDFLRRMDQAIEFLKQLPETNVTILSHGGVLGELSRRFKADGVGDGFHNGQVRRYDNVVL